MEELDRLEERTTWKSYLPVALVIAGSLGMLALRLQIGDIVAHIFHQETRRFYGLEHLWGDVPKKPYLK